MSNVDTRNGFNLATSGGSAGPRRQRRFVDSANTLTLMSGDAYTIEADGNIARVNNGTLPPCGIMEAVDLPLAGIAQGPMTYDYVPAGVGLYIIGIEDVLAEFEATAATALAAIVYDTGAKVDITDTTGSTTLHQSLQATGAIGDQLSLVRPVDRVNNDPYAQYARIIVKLIPANVQ